MDFFFFGSLMDRDVAEVVLGRAVPDAACEVARVEGFRRVLLAGESYPAMVPRAGGHVDGILMRGVTPAEHRRIVWFEDSEYDLVEVPVSRGSGARATALACLRRPGTAIQEADWSFARWQVEDKSAFLDLAGLWMSLYGRATVAEAETAWCALRDAPAAANPAATTLRQS